MYTVMDSKDRLPEEGRVSVRSHRLSGSEGELGECTPTPPMQEMDSADDSEEVIFLQEVVKKNNRRHSSESAISADDNDGSVVEFFDSEKAEKVNDPVFVLDTTGTVEGLESSFMEDPSDDKDFKGEGNRQAKKGGAVNMSMVLTYSGTPEPSVECEQKSILGRKKLICFNCGGNHLLDNCDISRDIKRITKNRSAYFKRQSSARYITDFEVSCYKPGVISRELREALGIRDNDIPEWIYRMRKMGFIDGYPPAYLKQAIEGGAQTVLKFYMEDSSFGDSGNDPDESCIPKINGDKMVQYPGFNVFSSRLNDRERHSFRIPSFSAFVQYHQYALANKIKEEGKAKQKSPNKRRRQENVHVECKKTRSDGTNRISTPDVKVLGGNHGSDFHNPRLHLPKDSEVPSTSNGSSMPIKPVTVPRVQSSPAVLGVSLSKCSGTPQGSDSATSNVKPDLEKFRKGIVPFEAKEDVNLKRGFFDKLMKLIKSDRTNK